MKSFARYSFTLSLALAACGDDPKQTPIDAPPAPTPDAPTPDAPADAAPDAPGYTPPTASLIDLSPGGPDQLQSITRGPENGFYTAGFLAETVAGPRILLVAKSRANGAPDVAFGSPPADGIAEIPEVDFKGGNDEIDVAVQSDGKIVVSATVANAVNPADRDIAVVRLLTTGLLDPSFDQDGIAVINLNDALPSTGALTATDAARGLTVNASGIFVHALSRGLESSRTDTDFVVIKLGLDGKVDETFGDQGTAGKRGQFRLPLLGATSKAARAIHALPDEGLLAVGYAHTADIAGGNQPVIYKLTAAGQLDTTFHTTGLFHEKVDGWQTEVYNIAIHGTKFVTGGYGRTADLENNQYISLRFDLATGERDTTWGAALNGIVKFDPSGSGLASNCRGAFALPENKTLLIGSTGSGGPVQDAVFAVLDATGKLDTTYGTGINKYKLGADGNDQFWGAAFADSGVVAIVGYKGETTQTETINDNAYALLFTAE